ncbi:MAG: macro domain-containing protein [Clostridia bacterium]|nr:macro domain-containing protein [Clostridia bacterium]
MKKFVNKKIAALLATLSVFTSKTQAMDIQKKVNNYQVLDNNFSLSEFLDQHKELLLVGGLCVFGLIIGGYLLFGSDSKDDKKSKLKTEKELKDEIGMFLDNLPKDSPILDEYFKSLNPKRDKKKCIIDFVVSKNIFESYLRLGKDIKCISTQNDIRNNKLIISHKIGGVNAKEIFMLEGNGSLKIQKVGSNQDHELILEVPKKLSFKYKDISINIQNIDIAKIETGEDEFKTNNPKQTVVVNAANTSISNGAGVAAAIEKAAGPEMVKEIEKWRKEVQDAGNLNNIQNNQLSNKRNNEVFDVKILETGHSKLGTAGSMNIGGVIHTPGPSVSDKLTEEDKNLLIKSYTTALEIAHNKKFERIVFSSISTGIYNFPIDEAAKCATKAIFDFIDKNPKTSIKSIEWAFLDSDQVTLMKMFKYYSVSVYSKISKK